MDKIGCQCDVPSCTVTTVDPYVNPYVNLDDDTMCIDGCPGNSYDIATKKFVRDSVLKHDTSPSAHIDRFSAIEAKIAEISGGLDPTSIMMFDEYGKVVSQIWADLTVLEDGLYKTLATTEFVSSFTPSSVPPITADILRLQGIADALSVTVSGLTGSVESLESEVASLKDRTDGVETRLDSAEKAIEGKQDALFFSSDFLTGESGVSLNYGEVDVESEFSVKGKDVYTSIVEASGSAVETAKSFIPTITLNTIE